MISYQVPRIQFRKPVLFQVIKINCKFSSFNLQLKNTSENVIPLKKVYSQSTQIPYMSYDDPNHSQK